MNKYIIKFPIQLTDLYILWYATSSVIKRGKQCASIHEKKKKQTNKQITKDSHSIIDIVGRLIFDFHLWAI